MVLKGSAALSRASSNLRTKKGTNWRSWEGVVISGICRVAWIIFGHEVVALRFGSQSCLCSSTRPRSSPASSRWLEPVLAMLLAEKAAMGSNGCGNCPFTPCIVRTYVRKGHISLILFMCSSCHNLTHVQQFCQIGPNR